MQGDASRGVRYAQYIAGEPSAETALQQITDKCKEHGGSEASGMFANLKAQYALVATWVDMEYPNYKDWVSTYYWKHCLPLLKPVPQDIYIY